MAKIDKIRDGNNNYHTLAVPTITTSTAAATATKAFTDSSITLDTGTQVKLVLTNGNTNTAPTLLAKTIIAGGYLKPEMFSSAGNIMELLYDGTNWIITGGIYGSN